MRTIIRLDGLPEIGKVLETPGVKWCDGRRGTGPFTILAVEDHAAVAGWLIMFRTYGGTTYIGRAQPLRYVPARIVVMAIERGDQGEWWGEQLIAGPVDAGALRKLQARL